MPKRSYVGNDIDDIVRIAVMLLYATGYMLDRLCRLTSTRLWRISNLCPTECSIKRIRANAKEALLLLVHHHKLGEW